MDDLLQSAPDGVRVEQSLTQTRITLPRQLTRWRRLSGCMMPVVAFAGICGIVFSSLPVYWWMTSSFFSILPFIALLPYLAGLGGACAVFLLLLSRIDRSINHRLQQRQTLTLTLRARTLTLQKGGKPPRTFTREEIRAPRPPLTLLQRQGQDQSIALVIGQFQPDQEAMDEQYSTMAIRDASAFRRQKAQQDAYHDAVVGWLGAVLQQAMHDMDASGRSSEVPAVLAAMRATEDVSKTPG